ncbi:hypothetical protein [Legionella worsleiensis]|uniref:Uncharacterized protein n=1 Tax=Legionella worsleiensis TaxID=45076 RepID=A0A0W1A684_9GAMM|nr:hypothetical protein [Legionella worsleiensis]KTD76793.1 hypothetical protein Lwor_2018 [Legionella worsleiensis]STY30627.1 Uncharacterised protein [Legionella worsleiensis]
MLSIPEHPSVIFSREINEGMGLKLLERHGANTLPTGAVWLLRESSVPGLITLSYYDAERYNYVSRRIGYVDGKWTFAPRSKTDALAFAVKATHAFSQESVDQLFGLMQYNGFDLQKQLVPKAIEATQTVEYSRYVHFPQPSEARVAASIQREEPDHSSSSRYSVFR